jgi:hypothetical protein
LRFNGNFPEELAESMKRQIDQQTTPSPDGSTMGSRVSSGCLIQPTEIDELGMQPNDIYLAFGIMFMAINLILQNLKERIHYYVSYQDFMVHTCMYDIVSK